MTHSLSITRRLTITVLIIELSAAIALLGTITVHEHRTQLKSFDAYLRGNAQAILGAVQEDRNDKLMLDLRGVRIPRDAIYSVQDGQGKLLGQQGAVPPIETFGSTDLFYLKLSGRDYRFLVLRGTRYIDPEEGGGGERHSVTVLYGAPVGHVWHEVFEADRFVVLATPIFLGGTAFLIVWLMRRGLSPVYDLAQQAEKLNSESMHFDAPVSAKQTTELRPLTTALETAMLRLRRSFEQQERFTHDAAHELKTNVAIIKSSLQLLRLRKRTVDEYDAGLVRCLDDLDRMETSVQKMLTLARLEQATERTALDTTSPSCSLRDAAVRAVLELTPLAELKRVEIVASYARDLAIDLDQEDALLLCRNVLLNALQHSPEGEQVSLNLKFEGGIALLTIEDHGKGISEIDLPHLFEPFYRADPSRSRKSGGTGLGLSICKAICKRLDGNISIVNSPTGGAQVMIAIPARPIS